MIILSEHAGYKKDAILEFTKEDRLQLKEETTYDCYFKTKRNEDLQCYSIVYDKELKDYSFNSLYMIGVDWVVENELSICVISKLNNSNTEIDVQKMLFEAMKETENLKHLDDLCEIKFNSPKIAIKQQQDVLTPLLIIQFLAVMQDIVSKGLKKSYYKLSKKLHGRVKGKVKIASTIKNYHSKGKLTYNNCTYEEFGLDSIENRILHKALIFSQKILNNYSFLRENYKSTLNYILVPFEKVSVEVSKKEIRFRKSNRFYKEYDVALQLAEQILRKYDFKITNTNNKVKETYPFWINMPKLFELYVFKRLKEIFPIKGEIQYHKKYHSLEPDFILNSVDKNYSAVIDAKYKHRYEKHNILYSDAAQVSGYTRLKSIRKELKVFNNELLKALIIYPNDLTSFDKVIKTKLFKEEDKRYEKLFKYGIQLPKTNFTQSGD